MPTLIRWAGKTPARIVRSYEEFFYGYSEDPQQILTRPFSKIEKQMAMEGAVQRDPEGIGRWHFSNEGAVSVIR